MEYTWFPRTLGLSLDLAIYYLSSIIVYHQCKSVTQHPSRYYGWWVYGGHVWGVLHV